MISFNRKVTSTVEKDKVFDIVGTVKEKDFELQVFLTKTTLGIKFRKPSGTKWVGDYINI